MRIELKSVTQQYLYGKTVLSALNLSIEKGEIVSILAGEGGGKTTLLKVIGGIEKISSGEVLHNGKPPTLKNSDIVMLFADGALFKRWTVFDNLAYPLKIRKVPKVEIASKILKIADMLNITSLLSFKPRELDVYDKKRVSFARVFLRDTKAILIDDFGAGLDCGQRRELFYEAKTFLTEQKKTVIYTTTQADEAASIADSIVVLHDGQIAQRGSAKEIYDKPQSIWAAQALDCNFNFSRVLLEGDDKLSINFGEKKLLLPLTLNQLLSKVYLNKDVLCGFHSEHLAVSKEGISLRVDSTLGLPNGEYLTLFENGWRMKSQEKYALSSSISVLPMAEKVMLFDSTNECSILK